MSSMWSSCRLFSETMASSSSGSVFSMVEVLRLNMGLLLRLTQLNRRGNHVRQGRDDFRPLSRLQAAIGVHPEALRGDALSRLVHQLDDVRLCRDVRRVNVVDA